MKVKLIAYTPDPERVVTLAARMCYSKAVDVDTLEAELDDKQIERLIKQLRESSHFSTFEHVSFTFAIEGVSRVLLAEITRHRIGVSFSVRSQRYCAEGECDFIEPYTIRYKSKETSDDILWSSTADDIFWSSVCNAKDDYKDLLENSIPREDARYVLPNATATRMIVTMNARALLHFFNLRCCCYDKETEVLTNQGWKFFKDLNHTELFYSMNPDTNKCEFVAAKEYIQESYQGTMVAIHSQSIDQVVTPNHQLFVSYARDTKTTSNFKFDRADTINTHRMIRMKKNCEPITGITTKNFELPGITVTDRNQYTEWTRTISSKTVDIRDLMYFLGVYISDGCAVQAGYHYNINITKGNAEVAGKIKNVMSRLTDNVVTMQQDYRKELNCFRIQAHDRRLYEFCKPLGKTLEKHLPDFIWQYDHSILFYLFQGLIDGDGHYNQKNNSYRFSTTSIQLRDQIQRLALHLGYSSSYSIIDKRGQMGGYVNGRQIINKHVSYDVSFIIRKNEPIIKTSKRNPISEILYNDKVYCVELEKNHLLYVRRNGKTVWSGNSRAMREIRELANAMLDLVKKIAPTLFEKAGASCVSLGYCPEGRMCCGKAPTLQDLKTAYNTIAGELQVSVE